MGVNSNRVEDFSSHESSTIIRIPTELSTSSNHQPPFEMIHSVCLPPKKTTTQKLKHKLSEIFFPDDPLYRFKNQQWSRKLLLALQFLFPIFQWAPEYNLKLFRSDIISGLTIASLAIPQGISYAKLANLPPIVGLYSSFVPPLIYSVLGSSRHLAVGPVSIASLVMGSMLGEAWSWQTVLMGIGFLVFLLTTRHISMKKPKLFWVSAAAPLTSVILSTLLVFCIKSKAHGISVIGHLPKGLNPPSSNMLYFDAPLLMVAIKTGIVTGILSLTEGIAVGRTFASMKNYQVDGNKEMMAIGFMNMIGSCTSCFVTTGSFSRSAVSYNAGAKSAVSNVVMSSAVLVTLLFLMPLFYYTPNAILGAIIITAVIGLIDYQSALSLWKVDKLDFLACLCSFFGVLFISVPLGLSIAVGVSVFKILLHVTRPNTLVLGNIPGTNIFQSLNRYREASRISSFLILSVESPIYFANSTYLQERILRWIREEEEWIKANNGSVLKCIILDMTAVTAIDTSGIDTVRELRKILDKRSLQLVLANPVGSVMEKLHQTKVLEAFGLNGLYLTVGEAVADISSAWKAHA
ncbi:hypothetical protein LWI29_016231 [Acer saccharum]|uniref:STAS domain-containing protein n=1 Tax=Acer saccharum TaxID=4024 RepID=A0AA39SVW1_ACESA|nr:hypothetical protein LWI29_016231 [Acer saccharum]